jgi:hypothetical protein
MGHLRTNAGGANLNREWADTGEHKAPSLERSPEVYHTLRKLKVTGLALLLLHARIVLLITPVTICIQGDGL